MKNRPKTAKPTLDIGPENGGCVKETDSEAKIRTDRYGVEPTFEQMQADLTGLYGD